MAHISIKYTGDGSPTLFNPELDEHYHSIHGALTESLHVFISHGFVPAAALREGPLRILEVGFGTGLNAGLTAAESEDRAYPTGYVALEPFPVPAETLRALAYEKLLNEKQAACIQAIHRADWEVPTDIHPGFRILKLQRGILDYTADVPFDLIYFDAFAPEKQPGMWEMDVLLHCYRLLADGGMFVTYCAKGQFKRNLKACGFRVERKPGPPGKREITVAVK